MSQAAQIRPDVLTANANKLICDTLRRNILAVMNGAMFTRYERVKAKLNTVQCHDAGQLQRWYANVQATRKQRETAAQWAAEDGDYTTGLDDDAAWQRELDECDKDAA